MRLRRVAVPLAVLVIAAAGLAGCKNAQREDTVKTLASAQPSPTASPTAEPEVVPAPTFSGLPATAVGPHAQPDIDFLTTMTVRARQVEVIARMADGRALSSDLKSFAARVAGERLDLLRLTSGWLQSWNAPVPPIAGDDSAGATGMAGPGLLTAAQLSSLDSTSGAGFDKQFIALMTIADQGAATAAQQAQPQLRNPAAKQLADTVISMSQDEIFTMKGLT